MARNIKNKDLKNHAYKGSIKGFNSGLTNGLTNGNGLSNGIVNGNPASIGKKPDKKRRINTIAAVGIVILVLFSIFVASTTLFTGGDPWAKISKYTDIDTKNINNANVNITRYAFSQDNGKFNFYIGMRGEFSESTNHFKNLAYIMIDNDSNPGTGFYTGTIGADYMIKMTGYGGTVGATLFKFSGANQYQWSWKNAGSATVIEKNHAIVGFVNYKFNSDSRIIVIAENQYTQDTTPVAGINKPTLVVTQQYVDGQLEITLIPVGGTVNVNKINMETTNVEVINSGVLVNIGKISEKKTIFVHFVTRGNGTVRAEVKNVVSSAFATTIIGNGFGKYTEKSGGIIIDGFFNDWKNVAKKTASRHMPNPNIDVAKYANVSNSQDNFFYISVTGSMLKGNIAPEMVKVVKTDNNQNSTSRQQYPDEITPKYPYDYAEIDFTTISGKTHVVKIWGYLGKVIGITLDGKDARERVSVGVGKDKGYGALEVELTGGYKITSYSIKMTDWSGHSSSVSSGMVTINVRALTGWALVGESTISGGGTGADLDKYYIGWDDVNLYLNLTTNNTASWDVAYGFALDVDQQAGSGFEFSVGGDAWGRHIDFNNSGNYLPDYEVYIWWSGTAGEITSDDLCLWNGTAWNYTKFADAGITNISSGDSSTGLQWVNITIPWTAIGGKPLTGQIATMAWVAGDSGSSAVDTVPYDASVPAGDSWTDWDSFGSMTEIAVPEFSTPLGIILLFLFAIPVIVKRRKA